MYEVGLTTDAEEFFEKADRPLAKKLARCFRQLGRNPRRHNNIKRLKGQWSAYWRYRVGDWRVVYEINEDDKRVVIMTIAHRSEVYE